MLDKISAFFASVPHSELAKLKESQKFHNCSQDELVNKYVSVGYLIDKLLQNGGEVVTKDHKGEEISLPLKEILNGQTSKKTKKNTPKAESTATN